jgi:L-amino acid N-acyltransferase YncA
VLPEKCCRKRSPVPPQLKVHSLVGLIFADNEPSVALFRTAGFERWGFLPAVARAWMKFRGI